MQFPGQVRMVNENYGASPLAKRFGVHRYPAVFVNDILIAKPKDFGFFGESGSQGEGRYTPWKDAANHEKFERDLTQMVALILRGESRRVEVEFGRGEPDATEPEVASLPDITLLGLDGESIDRESLTGRPVLVEFWATWCPPCRSTLEWLGELKRTHGTGIEVLALAVESKEEAVRSMAAGLEPSVRWAIAPPEVAVAFGDLTSVPTLFLFDEKGKLSETFYGAPPDLHARVRRAQQSLLGPAGT